MKEVIISTEAVNSYGSRVLTDGIDLSQYERNPVLLWMHRRSWEPGAMPIGKVENLRVEDGKLIGTPVFDQNDDFAKRIESKWENGYLRMASAGLEPIETTPDPALVLPGQTRETVTRSKLVEVSIVDIGGNDEALQLYGQEGKLLKLAAGEDSPDCRCSMREKKPTPNRSTPRRARKTITQNQFNKNDKRTVSTPRASRNGTEEQATAALNLMKGRADNAEQIQLAAVTQAVDQAVAERRILAEQRDHFIKLGKSAGVQMLRNTLSTMHPSRSPARLSTWASSQHPAPAKRPRPTPSSARFPRPSAWNSARITAPNICACSKRSTA